MIEDEPNFTAPAALENFINNGEPPLYIGFGSLKELKKFKTTFEVIIKAFNSTNQGEVVAPGWTKNNLTDTIPENIFLVESVPHTWLFPKMKMLIHHGGAGTTAAGVTAG